MREFIGHVVDANRRLVKDGIVILGEENAESMVALNAFNIGDISAIYFIRQGDKVEVLQAVALTDNPFIQGTGDDFRSERQALGVVSKGRKETYLVYHPQTDAFVCEVEADYSGNV